MPPDETEGAALAVEKVVEAFAAKTRIPSVTMGLVQAGRLAGTRSFGRRACHDEPPGADVLCRVGSPTKSFTAIAVLQFRDRGLIDLEAPVRRSLPWFELATPDADGGLVRHLLTQTSGIPSAGTQVVWPALTRIRPSLQAGVRALARLGAGRRAGGGRR